MPAPNQPLGFVARLSADGTTAGAELVTGAPDCLYNSCSVNSDFPSYTASWPLALRPDGSAVVAGTNGTVASADFTASSRVSCLVDPADGAQVRSVAPGQLLTIFGTDLAQAAPLGSPATGVGVTFGGTAAPVLYGSPQQVNVQVPYEVTGQGSVPMVVKNSQTALPLAETHTVTVTDRQPAVFLSPYALAGPIPGYSACGGNFSIGEPAVALNADGSLNDCTNPAPAGSVVTIFVDGLGVVAPAQSTGAIAQSAVTITPGLDARDSNLAPVTTVTSTSPGAISGVARTQFQLPPGTGAVKPYLLTPSVAGTTLRERLVLIWMK
jgi:uncharacterized protein (TIGR03437 family)